MKSLYANIEKEFILLKLKYFSEKKIINIKYIALYIYKKNRLIE